MKAMNHRILASNPFLYIKDQEHRISNDLVVHALVIHITRHTHWSPMESTNPALHPTGNLQLDHYVNSCKNLFLKRKMSNAVDLDL